MIYELFLSPEFELDMNFDDFLENDGENRQKLGQIPPTEGSQQIHWTLNPGKNLCEQQKSTGWAD